MSDELEPERAVKDAVEWTLSHGVAMKCGKDKASHTAFSFTPSTISRARFTSLKSSVHLLGKLIHRVSEDSEFLREAIEPITSGDAFFSALFGMYQNIHQGSPDGQADARRMPLLIMRSDFMDDAEHGPQLIECNSIAAGMGPFGQRAYELHRHIKEQWSDEFITWSASPTGELVENKAIEQLSHGIAEAAKKIRAEFGEPGAPVFLMVVQEDEDNVYDQQLLEQALQARGIKTLRRTFRELHQGLASGEGGRLILNGFGPIDTVYLRAGYQYGDYYARDLDSRTCCDALISTRTFIEQHRVAVNATVGQQLATSKRVQMLLSSMAVEDFSRFGLSLEESVTVKALLGEMRAVTADSVEWIKRQSPSDWVLKNQGEGGGHCIFDSEIQEKLKLLKEDDYKAWSLMRRLHPDPRGNTALVVRKGEVEKIDDLISEIGLFTIHIDGAPAGDEQGYAGYLIRSKSSTTTEGGVHSGMGVLDSLQFSD